jgi:hypothetical protein
VLPARTGCAEVFETAWGFEKVVVGFDSFVQKSRMRRRLNLPGKQRPASGTACVSSEKCDKRLKFLHLLRCGCRLHAGLTERIEAIFLFLLCATSAAGLSQKPSLHQWFLYPDAGAGNFPFPNGCIPAEACIVNHVVYDGLVLRFKVLIASN